MLCEKKDDLATITQGKTEKEKMGGKKKKEKKRDLRHKLCHKEKKKNPFFSPPHHLAGLAK